MNMNNISTHMDAMLCTYGYYLTYTCLLWLPELSRNCKVICGMMVYKWKRGAAICSVKWDILRNEQAPMEEFLCTYIWYTLLFHLPTIWMDACGMFACAAVVAALILQLWVLYWVLSKPSFDSKVTRMLLKCWWLRLHSSLNMNSGCCND